MVLRLNKKRQCEWKKIIFQIVRTNFREPPLSSNYVFSKFWSGNTDYSISDYYSRTALENESQILSISQLRISQLIHLYYLNMIQRRQIYNWNFLVSIFQIYMYHHPEQKIMVIIQKYAVNNFHKLMRFWLTGLWLFWPNFLDGFELRRKMDFRLLDICT